MTESMKYYESIRRKYPETVSKDQFYQIAHISKATALHLLQNGLVPCKDTGKKTRRYTIRTDDIIFYLIDRELHPEVYRAPDRWYQERSGHYNSRVTYRNELTKLSEEERANFRKYMEDEFCQYGDLLTVVEVAEAIGYCDTSLHRWCNAKKLKSFNISGRFLIPKISLAVFGTAFANPLPSFHPVDLLIGLSAGVLLKLAVYVKGKNRKKFRQGEEYGSARWGKPEDINPFRLK